MQATKAREPANTAVAPEPVPAEEWEAGADAPDAPPKPAPQTPRVRFDPVDAAWHLLTSVRFAFFLIVVLALASLVGSLVIQVPADMAGDAAAYGQWLEQIRPRYGVFTNLVSALGLFDVFHTVWFKSTVAVLGLSIAVCTVNRWPAVRLTLFTPRVRVGPGFFRAVPYHAEIAVNGHDLPSAAGAMAAALEGRGYRVLREEDGAVRHFYADRYRFSQLGTFSLHLGMILVLVGALWGSVGAYRERSFTIPEGSTRSVGFGTDLAVKLESFADEYYPDGPPKDYRSELVLYQGTQEVRRQTVRVNEPLRYQGWRFHQAFFGPAAVVSVQDNNGRLLFHDGVALAWRTTGDRAMGSFRLPDLNLTIYLVAPASGGSDGVLKAGELRVEVYRGNESRPVVMETLRQGQPKAIGNVSITFERERQFTGLQVVNDPSEPLVYTAWVMASLGLFIVFYFPYRRLWGRCQENADGTVTAYLGTTGRRGLGLEREFTTAEEAVKARLSRVPGEAANV